RVRVIHSNSTGRFEAGRLLVGPESAGAVPGPACYRNGGPLTVTDCNVMLGKLRPEFFPKVFGPNADGGQLEGSKAWMKALLVEAGVPTARHHATTDAAEAERALRSMAGPYVVKTARRTTINAGSATDLHVKGAGYHVYDIDPDQHRVRITRRSWDAASGKFDGNPASPLNRELVAQGVGNVLAGCVGAIPVTSVIIRSSVNMNAGGRTRLAAIFHGFLILGCVTLLPMWLNRIPLASLAAILLVTGFKLADPSMFVEMWRQGRDRFWPFVCTVAAIVLTDLLVGVVIGLAIAVGFILWSNFRKPIRRIVEKHIGGEVLHLRLANQVSFLNRAAMSRVLDQIPRGGHVLIDATETDYIDGDLLELIHDFERKVAPSRGVTVSLQGFHDRYQMVDRIQYVDYSTRDLQRSLTPAQALALLQEGHERFISGQRLPRDFHRQVDNTADGQFPFAVVLSCIDSRTPAEFIFDLGVGDIFSVRIAGNVATQKVIGSIEYACAVAGAKLVRVLGPTRCGAVTAAVELSLSGASAAEATGCTNLDGIIVEIQQSIVGDVVPKSAAEKSDLVEDVCSRNVLRTIAAIRSQSPSLAQLEREGRISVVGVKYDVADGRIQFLSDDAQIGKTRLRSEE
ncbi:MAG: carbonic anhydrase, partial [Planctomycetota bacterium]